MAERGRGRGAHRWRSSRIACRPKLINGLANAKRAAANAAGRPRDDPCARPRAGNGKTAADGSRPGSRSGGLTAPAAKARTRPVGSGEQSAEQGAEQGTTLRLTRLPQSTPGSRQGPGRGGAKHHKLRVHLPSPAPPRPRLRPGPFSKEDARPGSGPRGSQAARGEGGGSRQGREKGVNQSGCEETRSGSAFLQGPQ